MNFQELKKTIKNNPNIIASYEYGSYVYGTNHTSSDRDLIVIFEDINKETNLLFWSNHDVNIYSKQDFLKMIELHDITALECLFLDEKFIIKNKDFSFNLDNSMLRQSISSKSSNSWVKCKKKFIIEKDYNPYIGKKSAWHSLRIIDFGQQIAKHGKIIDYSSANKYYKDLLECNDWISIETKFKPILNELSTKFRELAPKKNTFP